jgi:hypothetical protein
MITSVMQFGMVHASASAARPWPGRRPEPAPAVQHTTLRLGVPRDQQKRAVGGRANRITGGLIFQS